MIIIRFSKINQKNFSKKDLFEKIKNSTISGSILGGILGTCSLPAARNGEEMVKFVLIPTAIGGGIGLAKGVWDYLKDKKSGAYQEVTKEKQKTKTLTPITIDEPESTKELLEKYPKLNDLRDFINWADKLKGIEFSLDNWGIIKDWQSLDCDIAGDDPLEATLFLRKELKSQDWISVLGYGEVGYKISENCFYEIDVYSSRMIKGKIDIKAYKKKLIDIVDKCINDENWCPYYYEYTNEDRKKMNSEILIPLKKILK